MPTSASATPKRSPVVDLLAAIPPAALLVGIAIAYLALDLARHGPAWLALRNQVFLHSYLAATVNGEAIPRKQLDLAVEIFLASRGQLRSSLPSTELRDIERQLLERLINDRILQQAAATEPANPPVDWVQRGITAFESGFAPGKLPPLCQAEGLNEQAFHQLLTSHLAQLHWLDQQASTAVSEAQVKAWFDAHSADLAEPEVIRARHLFLSTVEVDTPERAALMRDLHGKMERGEATLEDLAAQFSEDERTKKAGGDLGFFSRHRMPADFTQVVFALAPGQRSAPFRTSIGWHIVEVEEKLPARPADWETLRPEIALYLQNEAKLRGLKELEKKSRAAAKVERFL